MKIILKLSVHQSSIVHEARGLKRRDGAPPDTYVKVSTVYH